MRGLLSGPISMPRIDSTSSIDSVGSTFGIMPRELQRPRHSPGNERPEWRRGCESGPGGAAGGRTSVFGVSAPGDLVDRVSGARRNEVWAKPGLRPGAAAGNPHGRDANPKTPGDVMEGGVADHP